MDLDYPLLSRMGFALTASYHIIFPSLLIGLGFFLTTMEALWLKTGNKHYQQQYIFWLKPFTAAFIVAVVTGVGLSFQLDTHFGGFYYKTVDILTPIRHIELVNAIVLEAGSLGIMLWGWKRVGPKLHFSATVMMNCGLIISLVCIIARNSWMQTPDGYMIMDGQLILTDWFAAVFSPSFPYRFTHMLLAGLLSTACFMLGISALFLIRKRHVNFARYNLRFALISILILSPLQMLMGDLHGLNTIKHQPIKIAAIEGLWETRNGVPLILIGKVDNTHETIDTSLAIPKLASLILTHNLNGEIKGLRDYAKENRPNVALIFYNFRIMVGMGIWILLLSLLGVYLHLKKRLFCSRHFLRLCIFSLPSGFIATIAGWLVTEAGRQPWAVFGLIRTQDILLPISREDAIQSLVLMGVIYALSLVAFIAALRRIVISGPLALQGNTD